MNRHVDGDQCLAGRPMKAQSGESKWQRCSAKPPDGNNFTAGNLATSHAEPGARAEARWRWHRYLYWIGRFKVEAEQPRRCRPNEDSLRG